MLEIQSLYLKNFKSYGDYDTILELDDLGPCLITGEVVKDDTDEYIPGSDKDSNGAGKSTIVDAILWCLFGKTSGSTNPGDKVINHFTEKDCVVELKFKNGDTLKRTRNLNGHNDLLLKRNGADVSLGTTKMQQSRLNKELNLDWDNFCGSTFFSQFGRSWLEISDTKRKQAMEREFHMDRIQIYADVAKERADKAQKSQDTLTSKTAELSRSIERLLSHKADLEASSATFEENKADRVIEAKATKKRFEENRDAVKLYNIPALQKKWDAVATIEKKINDDLEERKKGHEAHRLKIVAERKIGQEVINKLEKEAAEADKKFKELSNKITVLNDRINNQLSVIKEWEDKSGEICPECKQLVDGDHIKNEITGPKSKIKEFKAEIKALENDMKEVGNKIDNLNDEQLAIGSELSCLDIQDKEIDKLIKECEEKRIKQLKALESKKPSITIEQAEKAQAERDRHQKNVESQEKAIAKIEAESNQYEASIKKTEAEINSLREEGSEINQKIAKIDKLILHLSYIHKAYHDRRKIKSYMLAEYIPYLNKRIEYYLNRFGMDLGLEFTNALGIKNEAWGYDSFSGGEKKRVDVAIMLAMFDLHMLMHGRSCNVIVFDEVDGRLDVGGAEVLSDIIRTDFASKVDSILVISQRVDMRGALPSEIKIKRQDRFSEIVDVIR